MIMLISLNVAAPHV